MSRAEIDPARLESSFIGRGSHYAKGQSGTRRGNSRSRRSGSRYREDEAAYQGQRQSAIMRREDGFG